MNASKRESSNGPSLLVVDDDAAVRFGFSAQLRRLGFRVVEAESCETAAQQFATARPDVVITDLRLPDGDGLKVLARIHGIDPTVPVFVVTGYGSIDLAVRAVKDGAENFLTKPINMQELATGVRIALDRRKRQQSGSQPKFTEKFSPRASAMMRVEEQIEKLRDADCTVLLLGETGTGKSVLARRIHEIGARKRGPLVEVNCAGLSRDFVESELFGHERGAFTGAHAAKRGLFDAADGGTLFLDEIGDVDLQVQPKLLKVLEEKRYRALGDVRERIADVRLVAATHHDLLAACAQGRFRTDLYYRVSTISITLPPLRERRDDVLPLAQHLLTSMTNAPVEIADDARDVLMNHPWPGNLREMKNVLERSLLLKTGDTVHAKDLQFDVPSRTNLAAVSEPASVRTPVAPSSRTLSEMEREHIQSALDAENGRVEAAARRLGMPRSTLYQRLKDYGMRPTKRARTESDEPPESA